VHDVDRLLGFLCGCLILLAGAFVFVALLGGFLCWFTDGC
jgi:hypothetical protein